MGDRVWVCTREPLFELLSAPLHPCVILMVIFSGLTFGAWRRERWRRIAYDLWRYLLFAALLVCAFFLLVAPLTRFAFGADPSAILRWVPAARAVAAGLAGFLVWRDRHTTPLLTPAPRWWLRLVLRTWAERGPSPALRAKAAMALECVKRNRQSELDAWRASCAAPGEVWCTAGRCPKNLGAALLSMVEGTCYPGMQAVLEGQQP